MNCWFRLGCSALVALLSVIQLNAQRISSTGQVLPYIADQAAAQRAESDLAVDPGNLDLVGQLLDYYLQHWQQADLHAPRLRLILWTIANHPDISLDGRHDPRGLFINPDASNDYALVRQAWLDQIALHPRNVQVLANAARSLRLTERAYASTWLKQAMVLDPGNRFLVSELGDLYADAIGGVSGENPWGAPTAIDAEEAQSDFARLVKDEAGKEPELAARTGWTLHQLAEAFQIAKIEAPDYDLVAEKLLIQSANLKYPKPAGPLLGWLYRDQQRKASDRILPKWRTVEIGPEEQAKRLVEKSKQVSFTDKDFHSPVTVPVKITIGIDGHVWKAEALGAPQIAGPVAAGSTEMWIYEPLRIDSEPVQVSTIVQVTVEPFTPLTVW
jgi:hypothetical protein